MKNTVKIAVVTIVFSVLLTACPRKTDQSKEQESVTTDTLVIEKTLTIVFLDVSGSFNKVQKQGGLFQGKNYFDESCKELVRRIRTDMKIGEEYMIVKSIRDQSFSDETLICKIDLTDDKYIFKKPIPDNDMRKNRWEKEKNEFENDVRAKIGEDKEKVIVLINEFKDYYIKNPTNRTDIVNAFNGIKPVIESDKYANYKKKFIVYSDFIETRQSLNDLTIDLKDVEIEGRFVSKNDFSSLDDYYKNLDKWKTILKCKKLTFKTPEECIK